MSHIEKKLNRPDPCLAKGCSQCCDPVRVHVDFPERLIPTDEEGERLWIDENETVIPMSSIEIGRPIELKTFRCLRFDSATGRCKDYESRPEICRKTSCMNSDSDQKLDQEHERVLRETFIKVNRPIK